MIRYLRINWLTYRDKINTWDYQWDFSCLIHNGISIIPKNNLISNIGIGTGTHNTNYSQNKMLTARKLTFPLIEKEGNFNRGYLKKYFSFFRREFKWF